MDISDLFTESGMRSWTDTQRDQQMEDARQFGQIYAIALRRLTQDRIPGDRPFSARLRALRVAHHIKTMERNAKRSAAAAEALNSAHKHLVLELPARREQAAEKAALRKAHKGGGEALPGPGHTPRRGDAANPAAPTPTSISDYFPKAQ